MIGSPDTGAVYAACRAAQEELARPVNATILSTNEWAEPESGFIRTVAKGALVPVIGNLT